MNFIVGLLFLIFIFYICPVFLLRFLIIYRWKARLTTIDLWFVLLPIVNILILIGRATWAFILYGKDKWKIFRKWFLNEEKEIIKK